MSPPVFHAGTDVLEHDTVVLDGPEGRHAATVRRLRPGERVDLTDGEGLLAECVVTAAGRASLTLDVLARHRHPPRWEAGGAGGTFLFPAEDLKDK